jgi:hypothetical protein
MRTVRVGAFLAGGVVILTGSAPAPAQCTGTLMLPDLPGNAINGGRHMASLDPDGPGPAPAELLALDLFLRCPTPIGCENDHRVHRLEGDHWTSIGRFVPPPNEPHFHLDISGSAAWEGRIVLAGWFAGVDDLATPNIVAWNGGGWEPVGEGLAFQVGHLAVHDGELIAFGSVQMSPTVRHRRIAAWNGERWRDISGTLDPAVLMSWAGEFSGRFVAVASVADGFVRIAEWDGTDWHLASDPIPGRTPFVFGDTLLLGTYSSDGPDRNVIFVGPGPAYQWTSECVECNWPSTKPESFAAYDVDRDGRLGAVAGISKFDWSTGEYGRAFVGSSEGVLFDRVLPQGGLEWTLLVHAGELVSWPIRYINGYPHADIQPRDVLTCSGGDPEFFLGVTNTLAPPTYRWSKDGVELSDGPTGHGSVISGSSSPLLRVESARAQDEGEYTCRAVNGTCGEVASAPARLTVCVAEFDCNGSLDFFDYLDFISAWSAMDPRADITGDGQVDFFDYLAFVEAFGGGCGR